LYPGPTIAMEMLKGMSLHRKYLAKSLLASCFPIVLSIHLREGCPLGTDLDKEKGKDVGGIMEGVDED
jgi:hypothetical protein